MEMRFIPAPLEISFNVDSGEKHFKREYDTFSQSDSDPISQWLKLAKARGETGESDQVLLTLVTELHRKVDQLIDKLDDKVVSYLDLEHIVAVDGVNFDHLLLQESILEVGKRYYCRIEMPIFPKRLVPIYADAISTTILEIKLMHNRDRKEWDGYITARERTYIREMKGN
jgi:hypothetical protein